MDKNLNIVEERINEKLKDFFDSPASTLNDGVSCEKKINLGDVARYTVGDIIRIGYIDRMFGETEAKQTRDLLNLLRSLELQKKYIYSSEQRRETQEKIDEIRDGLEKMGVLFDLSYEGILNIIMGKSKDDIDPATK